MADEKKKTTLDPKLWPGHFNKDHYDKLIEYSESRNFRKWDEYRKKLKEGEIILLEGADLYKKYL